MTYFPEVLSVPDGSRLDLLWQQQDALEGPDPGALLDALRSADAVGQARHGAGAEADLTRKVPQPFRDLGRRGGCGRAACAHQAPQGVQRAMHGALAVAVVGTHVASWGQREAVSMALLRPTRSPRHAVPIGMLRWTAPALPGPS